MRKKAVNNELTRESELQDIFDEFDSVNQNDRNTFREAALFNGFIITDSGSGNLTTDNF